MTAPTTFSVVARFDAAIDPHATTADAVTRFREFGDTAGLVYRDGETPCVYTCRRLRLSELQAARAAGNEDAIYLACFVRGIVSVSGLYREDGTRGDWTRPDMERALTVREAEAAFDLGEVLEAGAAIYGRSILGKGRPAVWPLPATSQRAVEALAVHRAVLMSRSADPSPSSSEQADPATTEGG